MKFFPEIQHSRTGFLPFKISPENIQQICATLLFLTSLVIIGGATLFPFRFSDVPSQIDRWPDFLLIGFGESGLFDISRNIFLFLPLGFSLAWLLQLNGVQRSIIPGLVLVFSAGCSYSVEILQFFLPLRFPSLIDILVNSLGGVTGSILYAFLKFDFFNRFLNRVTGSQTIFILTMLGTAILSTFPALFLLRASQLVHWDTSFHLTVGAERSGKFTWQGNILNFQLMDTSITSAEISQTFTEPEQFTLSEKNIIGGYRFFRDSVYPFQPQYLPNLRWKGTPPVEHSKTGLHFQGNQWLETTEPAAELSRRVMATSQFTLKITLATADTNQSGPARIISFARDPKNSNFALSQHRDGLVFQLRTPLTGKNGRNRLLYVPGIFANKAMQNLIITYNGSILKLFVNGTQHPRVLALTPWVDIPLRYLLSYKMLDFLIFKCTFYALIFIPFGFIVLNLFRGAFEMTIQHRWMLSAVLILPSLFTELSMMFPAQQNFNKGNFILGFLFTILPFCILKLSRKQLF